MIADLLMGLRAVERGLASLIFVAIVALVAVAAATRYVGMPLTWAIEVTQALFVWLCILAADLTMQRAGHFSVDMIANMLPPRPRQVLEVFNLLLIAALLGGLVYYGFLFSFITSGRPLPMTGITSAAATIALPVGFVLMLITLVQQLMARIRGQSVAAAPDEAREVM